MPDSPRMAPLLAQLDTSLAMALERLEGLTDDEFWWPPAPGAATVAADASGRLAPTGTGDGAPRTRTIALLLGHLGEMAVMRADYTDGAHSMQPEDVTWPSNADQGLTALRDGWARWRSALAGLDDAELDIVGRSDFPWGLDLQLPILDIAWWMNRELIHHTADAAVVRDLYASRRRAD